MEKIKPIMNKELKLTEYQYKGLLLEAATFVALSKLGIQPVPLHNPMDNDYANDQHLKVDLIFIHDNKLFGVECKNFSSHSHVGYDFLDKEVLGRFDNVDLPFYRKIIVFGVLIFKTTNDIFDGYDVLRLGYQVDFTTMNEAINDLTKAFKVYLNKLNPNPNSQKKPTDNTILYMGYKKNKVKLNRINNKLRDT
jgi:hypothetical protein